MTTSQVSQVESGKRSDPQFSTIVRLAVALGVSLDEIASLGGFAVEVRPTSKLADPLAKVEKLLLALRRDLGRASRKVDEAIESLPKRPA